MDKIPPQAHSFTDKPTDLNIKPHTPDNNPIDLLSQDDKRYDNYDSLSKDSEYMDVGNDNHDDIIDPTPHTFE